MREESVRLTGLASHLEVGVLVDGTGAWASINDTSEMTNETLLQVFLGVIPPDVLAGEFPFEKKFHDIERDENGELEEVHSFGRVHATVEQNSLVVRHYRDEIGPAGEELVAVVEADRNGIGMVEPPYTSLRQRDSETSAMDGSGTSD